MVSVMDCDASRGYSHCFTRSDPRMDSGSSSTPTWIKTFLIHDQNKYVASFPSFIQISFSSNRHPHDHQPFFVLFCFCMGIVGGKFALCYWYYSGIELENFILYYKRCLVLFVFFLYSHHCLWYIITWWKILKIFKKCANKTGKKEEGT